MEIFAAIAQFVCVDSFVIDSLFCIQFFPFGLVELGSFGILQLSEFRQVDEHRMKCIDGYGAIRIGIDPRVRDGCVVHRQHLDDALVRFLGPVNQQSKIAEVANAKAVLRTKREDRNHCAGTSPQRKIVAEV